MGLFGRDDRTQRTPPPEPAKAARQEAPAPGGGRDDQTLISQAVRIEGTLAGSGEIVVNGGVDGVIDGGGSVRIAPSGQVSATIHGRSVTVSGTVKGDITADERIELGATARVEGDMTAPRILIRDGASFKGQVNMRSPAQQTTPPAAGAAKEGAPRKTP